MRFSVTFSGANNGTAYYSDGETFEIMGGALAITQPSGERTIYAPHMWNVVDVEVDEGTPAVVFGPGPRSGSPR